jgi:hypothetical protein
MMTWFRGSGVLIAVLGLLASPATAWAGHSRHVYQPVLEQCVELPRHCRLITIDQAAQQASPSEERRGYHTFIPNRNYGGVVVLHGKFRKLALELTRSRPLGAVYVGLWELTDRYGTASVDDGWSVAWTPFPMIVISSRTGGAESGHVFGTDTYYLWHFDRATMLMKRPFVHVNPYW